MQKFLVLSFVSLLTACAPTDEQKANVVKRLPAGCIVINLGSYGSADQLVAVVCDGRQTTASVWAEQHGKIRKQFSSIVIGEEKP